MMLNKLLKIGAMYIRLPKTKLQKYYASHGSLMGFKQLEAKYHAVVVSNLKKAIENAKVLEEELTTRLEKYL